MYGIRHTAHVFWGVSGIHRDGDKTLVEWGIGALLWFWPVDGEVNAFFREVSAELQRGNGGGKDEERGVFRDGDLRKIPEFMPEKFKIILTNTEFLLVILEEIKYNGEALR